MKDMGIVQGSTEQARELIINVDTVYVHTDIQKIEVDSQGNPVDNLYSYYEVQYTKEKYTELITLIALINANLKSIDDVPDELKEQVQKMLNNANIEDYLIALNKLGVEV